jgi:transposase
VVLDLEHKRVVWIARGRDARALRGFFTALGPTRCAKLEAAAVDMWQAYGNEIRAHCPQVKLVYDFFHIVAIYGREVVDRVRVDETNRLAKAAGPGPIREARRVIKGARWLLLRNRRSLTTSTERVRLRDLLQANRALYHGLRAQGGPEAPVGLPVPGGGAPVAEGVVAEGPEQPDPHAAEVHGHAGAPTGGDPEPLPVSDPIQGA